MSYHLVDSGDEDIPFITNEDYQLGTPYKNASGFPGVTFTDSHGNPCYLQMSSICTGYPPGQSALWLGRNHPSSMHLDRDQVVLLVAELDSWISEGVFLHQKKDQI